MRKQTLLILVVAIIATSGCSARRGTWWPFSGADRYVESSDHQAAQWTGVEPEFPHQVVPARQPRLAFLNPFKWRKADQFQYEGEVIDANGCKGCGAEGQFAGNGRCDNCVMERVNDVIGDRDLLEPAGQNADLSAPIVDSTTFGHSDIPPAPEMNQHFSGKVVKPHPALSDNLRPSQDAAWQRSGEFKPVIPELVGNGSTRSDANKFNETNPPVPTTIMQDQRMNQYESPIPNWDGWEGQQENSKPARIVNQFNDDTDWSSFPRSKSIALPTSQKKGGEPTIQIKSSESDNRVIEIDPDQPLDIWYPSQQQDPKFEQFSLDDLFPPDMQPPVSATATQVEPPSQTTPEQIEPAPEQKEPTPSQTEESVAEPARSVMEDDNIEWGLPNQLQPSASESSGRGTTESHEKQYSLVDESERDNTTGAEESERERTEYERKQSEQKSEFDDESLYEDEEGEYAEDTDFSQSNADDLNPVNLSTRSEKDIIDELRNSTVPNRIVFDNTPQIPQQQAQQPAAPVVLNAKPVPHYQELRRLARLDEGAVDMSGQDLVIEQLPDVRKTPAIPASTRRIVEETEKYDFQPLPNLLMPTPLGSDDVQIDGFGSQAFDPDTILNVPPSATDDRNGVIPGDISIQKVDGTTRRNSVPIILKAAPTFVGSDDDSDRTAAESSNARIRFIKPSYQRELKE